MSGQLSRRSLLKGTIGLISSGVAAAALGGISGSLGSPSRAYAATARPPIAVSQSAASVAVPQVALPAKSIPKFVDPLPTFVDNRVPGTAPVTVSMEEFQQKVLPAGMYAPLAAPFNAGTYVWGYKVSNRPALYPGFTIEAQKGTPTTVTYINNLVNPVLQQYLTVDQTLHWADPLNQMGSFQPYAGPVPTVVHLHGGEVPSAFDGGPDSWFTPGPPGPAKRGPGYVSNTYTYPNMQEAATLWFHDHTLGITRLNVYAGMAAFYLLRDPSSLDTGIAAPGGLPAGAQEIELAIQDRQFDTNGQWLFPDGSPAGLNGPPTNPTVHPFWNPEFIGDAIVVNGKTWPFLNVQPRRYRFRLLNGSHARFYAMKLSDRATGAAGPAIWQIGTEGGLLDAPVMVPELLLAPGERADVIVDFSGFAGQTLTLANSAKIPFPNGTRPDPQTVGQIMQFRVVSPLSGTDNSYNPALGGALRSPMVKLAPASALIKRQLTLNEVMGAGGPLEVMLNNTHYDHPATETPRVGSTELWQIINTTGDAHPIHLHLVQFQLVSRQSYNGAQYGKVYGMPMPGMPPLPYGTPNADGAIGGNPATTPYLQGKAAPAHPNEAGWKDTVVMYPGQVTTILVRWAPQGVAAGGVAAGQNLYPFDPTAGPGYVWHCHILDHEDNDMMRRQLVQP